MTGADEVCGTTVLWKNENARPNGLNSKIPVLLNSVGND